ncbi:hypothetical protein PTI98_001413 [Pleurotus ostreatus]|nr:hypothetical protein PTI98_001413 [Pleurotus ostreatus]
MGWQKEFTLSKRSKGCHLVTDEVMSHIMPGLEGVQIGMLFLFIKHTSAALTVNENYDPDVRRDMDMALDSIVPEHLNWRHTDEGPEYVNAKVSWVRHGYSLVFTGVTFCLHFAVI